jgi:membrane-associated phospholipid phosphatase
LREADMSTEPSPEPQDTETAPTGGGARGVALRALCVVVGLTAWFTTQAMIARRGFPEEGIGDAVLEWLAPAHAWLSADPARGNAVLIASSLIIDALGIFLLGKSIAGPTLRPFLALLIVFTMRQICQGLCALPPPEGMIWRDPGFPSLLVTYGVTNDLFFSGHTAMAVLGSLELARLGRPWAIGLGLTAAAFEIIAVLVLRAHYTMDVFAGAVAALLAAELAGRCAPYVDRLAAGRPAAEP